MNDLVRQLKSAAGDYSEFDKHMGNDAAYTIEKLEDINAPLLQALIQISENLPYSSPVNAHIIARAAIAKATGEQA